MPSSLFKSSTYMSTPFCFLSSMHCSLQVPYLGLFLFFFTFAIFDEAKVKSHKIWLTKIFLERSLEVVEDCTAVSNAHNTTQN